MLLEKIQLDINNALKAGDSFTVEVLRGVSAALKNKQIEKRFIFVKAAGGDKSELELQEASLLTDEEVIEVLQREVKKRREAAELYLKGGRSDLADKEQKEMAVIQKYLPEQMSHKEVERVVEEVLATLRVAKGDMSFGSVMKTAMAKLKGRVDGGVVAEIIKEKMTS